MYNTLSDDYDRFVNWPARLAFELPFLEKFLSGLGQGGRAARVLDAACGTGMHALALAKKGYTLAGLDMSEGMIARARKNAAAEGIEIPFAVAGFNALSSLYQPGSFDALLCLGNSLPHLIAMPEVAAALADFATVLRQDGVLLVQNRNFDAVVARQERWMEPQGYRSAEADWVFARFYDFLADGLISFNILTLKREKMGDWKQSVATTLLRPQTRDELVVLAGSAGFSQVEVFGGLDGSDFDPEQSGNLVLVARKTSR